MLISHKNTNDFSRVCPLFCNPVLGFPGIIKINKLNKVVPPPLGNSARLVVVEAWPNHVTLSSTARANKNDKKCNKNEEQILLGHSTLVTETPTALAFFHFDETLALHFIQLVSFQLPSSM